MYLLIDKVCKKHIYKSQNNLKTNILSILVKVYHSIVNIAFLKYLLTKKKTMAVPDGLWYQ